MIAAWTPPLRRVTPSAAPRAIGTRPSGPRVAYQGEPGAFGEAAVERHWSGGAIATGTPSFARALELLVARGVDLAVIPVSNSTIGAIPSVRELLDAHADAVHQVDEIVLPVRHALVALPGASLDSVRVIGSHFAALAQCAGFLRARPEVSTREAFDTAGAARQLAALVGAAPAGLETPWYAGVPDAALETLAAIAGESAAERHGLTVLARDVQDRPDNETRFAVVARREGARW